MTVGTRPPVHQQSRRRGQPVAALVMILGGWIGARAMILEAGPADPILRETAIASLASPDMARREASVAGDVASASATATRFTGSGPWQGDLLPAPMARPLPLQTGTPLAAPLTKPAFAPVPARMAAGHLSLWMAAVGQLPLPLLGYSTAGTSVPLGAPFPAGTGLSDARKISRWSADGWLMWRQGGRHALGAGPAGATYGASQTGAVLRYRLDPDSGHRPAAFIRATGSLNGSREKEVAIGLSARPLARLPVFAAVELRAASDRGGSRIRPAAFAVTEFSPFALPLGMRGETYLQAGYVGGGNATPFADGQLRVDREIARIGTAELRAGGGAWGGAQKGAARLDLGPSASLGMPMGREVSARLGIDWRLRVAGNAAPASGPAITLSAGF